MKVLLQGDTHGNGEASGMAFFAAQKMGCEQIIQLGDHGFGWDVWAGRCKYTRRVSKRAVEAGIPFWWIDGNHENFDLLTTYGAFPDQDAPVEIEPMVWYVPRGYVTTLGESRVLFAGGAYSVDKQWRTPHVSWWEQEELTAADVARCEAAGTVDVVLSHDVCDTGFRAAMSLAIDDHGKRTSDAMLVELEHLLWKNDQAFPEAKRNRNMLEMVLQSAKPNLWAHGHYHAAYETRVGDTTFRGLTLENEPGALHVVDL